MNKSNKMSPLNSSDLRTCDYLMLLPFAQHGSAGLSLAKISLNNLHRELNLLANGADIPASLCRYYGLLGTKYGHIHAQLDELMRSTRNEIRDFVMNERPRERAADYSTEQIARLVQINSQLVDFEKAIFKRVAGLRLHDLENPVLNGLSWDEWDGVEVELQLRFALDPERPSYYADDSGNSVYLEQISINILTIQLDINDVKNFAPNNQDYWGLADGNDHNDIHPGWDHPLAGLHLCTLFHELFDHAEIGGKGMLQLKEVWFDIKMQQSGDFKL
jgi:hypothetical protein